MKTLTYTLLLTIFISVNAFSQGGKHMQKRNEIMKKQIEFVISELQLTEKEKKEFVPIFKDFNLKKEEFYSEKRKRMFSFHKNSLNYSDADLTDLADFLVNTDLKLAELGKIYNEKFKKVLPPMKVILLHKAEHEFKRKLIKKMKHKGPGPEMHP